MKKRRPVTRKIVTTIQPLPYNSHLLSNFQTNLENICLVSLISMVLGEITPTNFVQNRIIGRVYLLWWYSPKRKPIEINIWESYRVVNNDLALCFGIANASQLNLFLLIKYLRWKCSVKLPSEPLEKLLNRLRVICKGETKSNGQVLRNSDPWLKAMACSIYHCVFLPCLFYYYYYYIILYVLPQFAAI